MSSSQPLVPINRLPPETLTEIFSHTLSSGVRFMLCSPKFKSPISSPWALSLVCRSWKTLVYSTPSFWSSLSIDFVAASEVCRRREIDIQRVGTLTEALIRAFQNSLLRSRDHPLHISIISDSDFTAIQFLPQVLLLCLEHCKRWEGAYLEFWCDMLDLRFPNLLEVLEKDCSGNKRSFPRLRNISLKGPGSLSTPASIPSGSWLRIFQDSPLLSSVWFRGDPHLFPELGGVFTWSNLTQFSTEMSSVWLFTRCNEILRTMHRLTVFKLTLSPYPSQPNIPGAEISFRDAELPELQDFWIFLDDGGPYDLSMMFKVLPRTPRLSSFSLQPRKTVSITDDFLQNSPTSSPGRGVPSPFSKSIICRLVRR